MKVWTYEEMEAKVLRDLDLEDETFISPDEMAGYFNEALNEAESEIMVLNQEYLLTKAYLPVVSGTSKYDLPYNMYANKIRGLMYINGAIIYEVTQFRRKNKFLDIAFTDQYNLATDYYGYLLLNDVPGQAYIQFHPAMRDTAILAPLSSQFSPLVLWFIRNCARIPMLGEFCNPEVFAVTPTPQVDITDDSIVAFAGLKTTTYGSGTYGNPVQGNPGPFPGSINYVTGDKVRFKAGPGGALPSPLLPDTDYFIIATGTSFGGGLKYKVAATRALAFVGTAINLTTVGSVFFQMEVACTASIRNATLIDIPEFSTFLIQWVKCRCLEKESDPRLSGASQILVAQKKQMIETLVKAIDDDDDTIQGDFRHYWEMT